LRVVFAGTPPFAAAALEALARAGHSIPLVLTQPDRPAGRGLRETASAVAQSAARLGLRVEKPATLKDSAAQELIRSASPEVMVVAAYGLLLPEAVLAIPRFGCLNIHASLLPRWRGAAPVQRAILAGDAETGVGIMQMEKGLDTGPVRLEKRIAIEAGESAGELTARLASLGAAAIVEALGRLEALPAHVQDASRATYAAKVAKSEARIDWSRTSEELDRQVRAFNPAPGAEAAVGGEVLKIWKAKPAGGHGTPGEILEAEGDHFVVATGSGALALLEVQKPGGRRVSPGDFLRGARLYRGATLDR